MKLMIIHGDGLKVIRKALNISTTNLANRLGITRQSIHNIENNKCNFNKMTGICLGMLLLDELRNSDIPDEIKEAYISIYAKEIDL